MPFLRKYNTLTVTGTTAIRIPIIKRAVVDFAVSADWTPATGDVKIAIDGAAAANVTNLPTAVAMGNTAYWEFILTAAELTCKSCVVTVADSATKAVEDQSFIVETFGHASAMYQADLSAANLPANATQFAGQTITAAAGVTLPSSVASPTNITAATGVVLSGVTHTGAVIPTVSTLTGHTPQTGDSFARIGATGSGLTSLAPASTALSTAQWTNTLATNIGTTNTTVATNLDATITSRMATYTQPTGFLAATFPSDPADQSAVEAAITAATSPLATQASVNTIDDFLDTEIAAIKTKTDQLTFTTANKVDSTAVLDSSTQTQVTNIENASGYMLAVLAGACANPQTSAEQYDITAFGVAFRVVMAGQTSTGTRTAPTLSKP